MAAGPRTLIVGAGIGGLTAAIALRRAGVEAEVFERAPELGEIGAGIVLSANATRVLGRLGLLQDVASRGTVIRAAVGYRSGGGAISSLPVDLSDAPSIGLHRAELQQALLAALPRDCIHLGHEFERLEASAGGVTAHFAGGRAASGDVLIGADGLRSRVRARLIGDGEPEYRGYQCWRGVCSLPAGDLLTESWGAGMRVGLVPVGRRGTAWWCTANEPEDAHEGPGAEKAKLVRLFGRWHAPIPAAIAGTDAAAIIKNAICDRDPVRAWGRGACTLLGDAAHPATPNMGQGGCMAIEDAAVLALCLPGSSDPAAALRAYERLRFARTADVTRNSRRYGAIGQWENPAAVWLRSLVFRLGSARVAARSFAKFAAYDPYGAQAGR
jgi:2-polyprenyl-6-methoxyphenol hydroxylase-like FAD-dependent oxidoreductase